METTEKAHSKLGASSYHQWKECPATIRHCKDIPNVSSVYAAEGTLAHDLAADILSGKKVIFDHEKYPDMEDAVSVYIKTVEKLRAIGPDFEAIEQKFDLSYYHKDLFGTADYVCYFNDTKTLYVLDYKHGAGVAVEVVDPDTNHGNDQLMYYGLGALYQNKFPVKKVVLTIVQPRCYHPSGPIRSFDCEAITMMDFAEELISNAKRTEDPEAEFKTGDHCRWCRGQATCPEKRKEVLLDGMTRFTPVTIVDYDAEKLADSLSKLDQIESWCRAVRSFAYSEAEAGRVLPGYKLVDKRPSRKWKPDITPQFLADKFKTEKIKFLTEPELKSPPQVEKLLSKENKKVLETLIDKVSSGKNLVPMEDNRPAVLSSGSLAFSKVETV